MNIKHYLRDLKNNGYTPKNILDIGANIGEFSIFCKSLWRETNILMVEGNYECENDLKRINLPYKIELLGDEERIVTFFKSNKNKKGTGNSYYRELTKHFEVCIEEERKLNKLSNIVNDEIYNLIKIDTQGSELDIIKGGVNVIKNADIIILEVSIKQYNLGSPLLDDVLLYMSSLGFYKHEVIESHKWLTDDYGDMKQNEIFQIDIAFKKK